MTMETPDPAAIEAERQRQMEASGGGMDLSTPQGVLAYYAALAATPQGQAAIRAQQQTAEMNVRQANAAISAQKAQIAIQQGQAAANAWYQQQQVKIAQQAHELAVTTQQQNNAIAAGGLTGTYNGQPTLANLGQQAQYTGLYGGNPTLQNLAQQANYLGTYNGQQTQQAINQQQQYGLQTGALTGLFNNQPTLAAQGQQQQFGLNQGALTGTYGGAPTLAAIGQQQQYGLNLAGVTGYGPNGAPTLANQQFVTGATGYYGGAPTLAREQAAAGTALQAGQLAASLQGPGNWAKFLQAQNGVAGSPASSFVQSTPGGLGAAAGPNPPPMTLASVLGDWGVNPSTASASHGQSVWTGGGGAQNGQSVWAGGSPGFNEQTGQYNYQMPQAAMGQGAGRSADLVGGGTPASYAEGGGGGMGYDPMNPLGAIGQVANAPRVTNAQLGLSDDEASTLQGYFNAPNSAPTTWWASKSPDEKSYLNGLNSMWGGSPDTFAYKQANALPRQGAWNQAA